MQAGLLPVYFLQQLGLEPSRDLAACTYYDERPAGARSDERDVLERVLQREYDAGAVSKRTLDVLRAEGTLKPDSVRILWSSPGYGHCCFTAHSDMDPALVQQITQVFVAITNQDAAGKAVLEGEACSAFVPGMPAAWDTLAKAAEQAGIL
jgi:ABC-type phosphate/phosphonate transport system substrate-binding protein